MSFGIRVRYIAANGELHGKNMDNARRAMVHGWVLVNISLLKPYTIMEKYMKPALLLRHLN